jgi:flagellar biosynthesis protein FliR
VIPLDTLALSGFVVFCRVGACIMLLPGFSSARVPARVRLFIALGAALAMTPLVETDVRRAIVSAGSPGAPLLVVHEICTGAAIGALARICFLALETLAMSMSMATGLTVAFSPPLESDESLPTLASFIMFGATAFFFIADLHGEALRAIFLSYKSLPAESIVSARAALTDITDQLQRTFLVALQVASPFLTYAVIVNLAFGLINKMTPQVPIYFVGVPFILLGGLFLLYATERPLMLLFMDNFASWLARG